MYLEKVGGVHFLSIALLLKSDVISGWPSLLLYCVRHGQKDILIYNMSEVICRDKKNFSSAPADQEGQEGHVGVPDGGVVGGRGQGPSP